MNITMAQSKRTVNVAKGGAKERDAVIGPELPHVGAHRYGQLFKDRLESSVHIHQPRVVAGSFLYIAVSTNG